MTSPMRSPSMRASRATVAMMEMISQEEEEEEEEEAEEEEEEEAEEEEEEEAEEEELRQLPPLNSLLQAPLNSLLNSRKEKERNCKSWAVIVLRRCSRGLRIQMLCFMACFRTWGWERRMTVSSNQLMKRRRRRLCLQVNLQRLGPREQEAARNLDAATDWHLSHRLCLLVLLAADVGVDVAVDVDVDRHLGLHLGLHLHQPCLMLSQ